MRRPGESRFETRLTFDPQTVLDTARGKPYIQELILGKFKQAKMADVFSPEFQKKYVDTVKTYKAIMESFKLRRAGKGGKKGEVSGKSANTDSDQVVEIQGAAATEVSPPPVSKSS